jgi:UPF0716 family protein affecting phage T7 exclusion
VATPELDERQERQLGRVQLAGVVALIAISISATVVGNLGLIGSWTVALIWLSAMVGFVLIGSWRVAKIEGCSVASVMRRSWQETRTDAVGSARGWARRANPRRWE